MSKFKLLYILVLIASISSCDPSWEAYVTLFANNTTSKDIMIGVLDKTYVNASNDYNIYDVLPGSISTKLESYVTFNGTGMVGPKCMDIIVYNKVDSTYIVLSNCADNRELYLKHVSEEYTNMPTRTKYNSVNKCDLNIAIIIDDELLLKMTKNTALTDSIFNLKN